MILKLKTRQTDYGIITKEEAKEYMRIPATDTSRNASISSTILTVTDSIEEFTGRFITEQIWQVIAKSWTDNDTVRELPFGSLKYGNLISLDSVIYIDEDSANQTVSSSLYNVNGISTVEGNFVFKNDFDFPATEDDTQEVITIEFTVGYPKKVGPPDDYKFNIPESIKTACKLWVEALEDGTCGDKDAKSMLKNYRYWWGQ